RRGPAGAKHMPPNCALTIGIRFLLTAVGSFCMCPAQMGDGGMLAQFSRRFGLAVSLAMSFVLLSFTLLPAEEPPRRTVKIGLPANLFRDFQRPAVEALLPTFGKLMEGQTGMKGQPMLLANSNEVAQQLIDGKVQLGVFHGFEYAWAQSQHPELKPLVIAVSQNNPHLTAQIVVPAESSINRLE